MAIFWLFHRYAKEPLWTWLPETIRQRVKLGPRTPPLKGAAQSALVLVSILVGAATHILWDSFTHSSYWPTCHLHFLSYTIRLPITGSIPCYGLLQYASSVLGTIVFLIWIVRQLSSAPIYPRSVENSRVQERKDLLFVSAVALTGGALRALVGLRPPTGRTDLRFSSRRQPLPRSLCSGFNRSSSASFATGPVATRKLLEGIPNFLVVQHPRPPMPPRYYSPYPCCSPLKEKAYITFRIVVPLQCGC